MKLSKIRMIAGRTGNRLQMVHRLTGMLLAGLLLGLVSLSAGGCAHEQGGGYYSCSYEQSRTDGCDGMGFEPYVWECVDFNSDDYWISPEEVCANITDDSPYCQGGCCIDYRFRNVYLTKGTCNLS